MASDDDYEYSDVDGDDMMSALEVAMTPCKPQAVVKLEKSPSTPMSANLPNLQYLPLWKEPDFEDPAISQALRQAETSVIPPRSTLIPDDEEALTLTRAQLDLIKRNAFTAGRQSTAQLDLHFRFLDLPTELRLIFYTHYFQDRNRKTHGHDIVALPKRPLESVHCCSEDNTWCKVVRPWISTNLLATCKHIYHEARDEYLYRNRRFFVAITRFDKAFSAMRPALRFWQHIQHLTLEIMHNRSLGYRYETGNGIVHLIALLRGGQNLKSFKLKFSASGREDAITRFKDLNVSGAISVTQVFRDSGVPSKSDEKRREERLERLLFAMLGCNSYDAPAYDFISSFTDLLDGHVLPDFERYETQVTISTGFD